MNNLETLVPLADAALRGPAEKVQKLMRHLAEIQKRADAEAVALVKAEDDLARLKREAGSYLSDSGGSFDRYKTLLKKALVRVETSAESVKIFTRELVPTATRDLAAARQNLERAAAEFYARSVPGAETEMARLMTAAVAVHDDFLAAFAALRQEYGCGFPQTAPVVRHARIGEVARRHTGNPWLMITPAPPAAVPAQPVRVESTRTGEKALGVEEARPLPPEASTEAPGAAGGAAANRVRVLRRTSATKTPEAAPADLDAAPDLDAADADPGAVDDAPDDGDLAEAPPADG